MGSFGLHRANSLTHLQLVERVGVLRLRGWFASRTSRSAQDDSFVLAMAKSNGSMDRSDR